MIYLHLSKIDKLIFQAEAKKWFNGFSGSSLNVGVR